MMLFAALHESAAGPSRHFFAAQNLRHFGPEADISFGGHALERAFDYGFHIEPAYGSAKPADPDFTICA